MMTKVSLAQLPNLGPKSAAALADIGIHTTEQLLVCDVFEIYAKLKKHNPRTSLNFLYALIGAVENRDWREVQRNDRTQILLRLDDMGLAPK